MTRFDTKTKETVTLFDMQTFVKSRMKQKLYAHGSSPCRVRMKGNYTVKAAAKQQAKIQAQESQARPTISLTRVMTIGPDTSAFSGWGPKVSAGNILKNWN